MAKEVAQQQDQSMEEILQSIKRIIAEEGEEEAAAAAKPGAKVSNAKKEEAPAPVPSSVEDAAGADDVLELTEVMEDDVPAEEEETPMPEFAPSAPKASTSPAPIAEPLLEVVDREIPAAAHKDVLDDIDSLLSKEAVQASAKALRSIPASPVSQTPPRVTNPGMPFRSGATVEDLAMEALRPMLKDWLESNLPGIVEQLVEREIKKISRQ